jgi:phage gp46-like protein
LKTAVVISLFTDRRAASDDALPAGDQDRRGWWGDSLASDDGDQIGSLLWLLLREKQTAAVLRRAETYAQDALQWLVDDRIALSVTVIAEWVSRGLLGLAITIERPNAEPVEFEFNHLWENV